MESDRNVTRRGRDGFILVSVLGIMALVAALIGAASLLVRSSVDGARTSTDRLVLSALVRAGVELAGYQLFSLESQAESINGQQVRLDAGTVTLFVADESRKIDLNGAAPELLAGAYRASGLSTVSAPSFAARVVDWRDEDNQRSTGGAEAADYAAAGLEYRPQNDAFRAIDDLKWLLGLSPREVKVLSSKFTVYNPDGKVNVLGATREVLLALPAITPSFVDQVIAIREGRADSQVENKIRSLLQKQMDFIKFGAGPAYRVRVEARAGEVSSMAVEAVLIPAKSSGNLYYVVEWSE